LKFVQISDGGDDTVQRLLVLEKTVQDMQQQIRLLTEQASREQVHLVFLLGNPNPWIANLGSQS
jgi:uncharacterized radical SAM superfamily protein